MIFVTVGTHEQQFNRLVEFMDKYAVEHSEEVVIQTGYSTYEPQNCSFSDFYSYDTMVEMVEKARIIITHGGPSSFFMPLQIGKIPIVVPRLRKYNEHVNDHQLNFCRTFAEKSNIIIVAEDLKKLSEALENYDEEIKKHSRECLDNNARFCEDIETIVEKIFIGKNCR